MTGPLPDLFAPGQAPAPDRLRDIVPDAGTRPRPADTADIDAKLHHLMAEFTGRPLLAYYHAGLIVHIRRTLRLPEMTARFDALWATHTDDLLTHLNSRWLISACDTIADHARDPQERTAATAASACLNTLRFYETERRGRGPDLRPLMDQGHQTPLYDGMIHFGIGAGDGVRNLLRRIAHTQALGTRVGRILATLIDRAAQADTVLPRLAALHREPATAWAPPPSPRRRIALFNDTSHASYGGKAVSDTLDRLCAETGQAIIHRHPAGQPWQGDAAALSAIAAADSVVLNGADALRSGGQAARALAALAGAATQAGRPAYLVNAALHDPGPRLTAALRGFRHIWVRDGISAAWAAAQGLPATLLPDLSLCQTYADRNPVEPGTIAVIDSPDPATNAALFALAGRLDTRLWSLSHDADLRPLAADPRRDTTPTWRPTGRPRPLDRFARTLSAHEGMVAGRFHAVCLAMVLGIPFLACPSASGTVQALLADTGLGNRLWEPGTTLPTIPPFAPEETAAIRRFLQRTRFEAAEMALRIADRM